MTEDTENAVLVIEPDVDQIASCMLAPVPDSPSLLDAYEDIRHVLPAAQYPANYERSSDLATLTDRYDAFFFDAFGVLNIGDTAIETAAQRVRDVRQAGRHVRIVSNAASTPVTALHQKYANLGFDFSVDEIVSSRMALIHHLRDHPSGHWGVMAPAGADLSDLGVDVTNLSEHPEMFDHPDGFILLSTSGWTRALQHRLLASLLVRPRTVLLANPDLAAPREYGFSTEPGQIAQGLRQHAGCHPVAYGKPHRTIFELALNSLPVTAARNRVLMIGDTLHTDILGGCHAGLHTALVTAHGASAQLDWEAAIRRTGIIPHHVLNHI